MPPSALAHRDGQVALLGARLDLVEDLIRERVQAGRGRLGVSVLGPEVVDRVRIVFASQPGVLVGDGVSVEGALAGDLLGRGRLGEKVGAHENPV
jgi:hypothetical protein